jgi:hypothetical protein
MCREIKKSASFRNAELCGNVRPVRPVTIAFLLLAQAVTACALEPPPGSDAWLTNAPPLPAEFAKTTLPTNSFATLRAEVIAGRLRITWDAPGRFDSVRVVISAEALGHWPARDWRTFSMKSTGKTWNTELPVDNLEVPVVYFLLVSNAGTNAGSPMRIAWPGALGLEQPTRLFWPFIEGFEQGTEGWRIIYGPPFRTKAAARNGRSSLAVTIPPGRSSVTLVTTRLRGWFLQEHHAAGIELWIRTQRGKGMMTPELLANAFSTNQVIARQSAPTVIGPRWTRVDLLFSTFPKFPLGELDLFSIELTGETGMEFLLDDVQLLGRRYSDY